VAHAAGFAVTGCDRVSVGAHTPLIMESGHSHLSIAKHGTAVDARDAAVPTSDCHLDRRALTGNGDGSASGQLAHALDLLVARQ
jgi:hypothetical protein